MSVWKRNPFGIDRAGHPGRYLSTGPERGAFFKSTSLLSCLLKVYVL